MILLIDNYDSFAHNLARYFERLGEPTRVIRNDAIPCDAIDREAPDAIVLSPGPCTPAEAGDSIDLVRRFWSRIPMFGVCLGHQTIAAALGGRIVRASAPMHGRTSQVRRSEHPLFDRVPNPFTACRYHSLVVEHASLPECLQVLAWSDDGAIMAIGHRDMPVFGVQFHPESVLTEHGYAILANFLTLAGRPVVPRDRFADEVPIAPRREPPVPIRVPVTF
ncbi:MAG: aminodeoxychorismate/anthranilate synthase component II [Planctomycetes bacterium]|nr:aminodeoxychorismate/anthranilate synthase component II [Planctomycetota bacterium]